MNAANAELRKAPVRESADPKADAVAKALAFIGIDAAVENVRYALILLPAIVAELMVAFGAAMCGVRLPSVRRRWWRTWKRKWMKRPGQGKKSL